MRYILYSKRSNARNSVLANTPLLHRMIKSNAMAVDTTCMQAGLADPRAGAYTIRNYKHGATSGLALADADECKC